MAPTPADADPPTKPDNKPPETKAWSTGGIVVAAVFGFLFICLILTVVLYFLHKRSQLKKLPPENRPKSYHPFRTEQHDKSGLLANAAPSPEDDKSSMFSRDRSTSLSLYVDTEAVDRRASMETVNLVPLHITPAQEVQDPMAANISNGSGVSRGSSRFSVGTGGSLGVSPIEGDGDLGSRPTRPRSVSSMGMRYYSTSSPQTTAPLPIPKIVHTPSE